MTGNWMYGWEATPSSSGNPPKRSHPIDIREEIDKTMARIAVRDGVYRPSYRQTTDDETWLNNIGITGMGAL
jgi:hypothetical protein